MHRGKRIEFLFPLPYGRSFPRCLYTLTRENQRNVAVATKWRIHFDVISSSFPRMHSCVLSYVAPPWRKGKITTGFACRDGNAARRDSVVLPRTIISAPPRELIQPTFGNFTGSSSLRRDAFPRRFGNYSCSHGDVPSKRRPYATTTRTKTAKANDSENQLQLPRRT